MDHLDAVCHLSHFWYSLYQIVVPGNNSIGNVHYFFNRYPYTYNVRMHCLHQWIYSQCNNLIFSVL